jgi:transcriptional regulator with XRE-family HTH domain
LSRVDRRLWLCYDATVRDVPLVSFLNEVMRLHKRLPSQLAADLGVSHATVSRWLSGEDIPSIRSCRKLAEYSGVPVHKVLSIAGHLPRILQQAPAEWPEFREYASAKYPDELDEDLIAMIEDLIQRRRRRRHGGSKDSPVGS